MRVSNMRVNIPASEFAPAQEALGPTSHATLALDTVYHLAATAVAVWSAGRILRRVTRI